LPTFRGSRAAAAVLLALSLACGPAAAQTVVDGSERGIPPADLAKLLEIVGSQGGKQAELRALRKADSVSSIMYCGRMRLPPGRNFVPILVNVTAGIAHALTDSLAGKEREYMEARLGVFGCLK
jgi:hypothetical protein